MNVNRRPVCLQLAFVVAGVALTQVSAAGEPESLFKYSDEWSLVSAPPPAGPYQPINIDPRVPGPGTISQMPMAIPHLQAAQELPDGSDDQAGEAATLPGLDSGAENQAQAEAAMPQSLPPVPGHYQPVMTLSEGEAAMDTEPGETATLTQGTRDDAIPVREAELAAGTTAVETAAVAAGEETAAEIATPAAIETPLPVTPLTADVVTEESLTVESPVAQTPQEISAPYPVEPAAAAADAVQQGAGYGVAGEVAAAVDETPADDLSQVQAAPAEIAGAAATPPLQVEPEIAPPLLADMPPARGAAGPPATALQEQPGYETPAMPGYYEQLAPPAAGRVTAEPYPARPAAELREQAPGQDAAGGYYGRSAPAPGYGYPAPGYPYQSGRPGYWNMPPYGYSPGQAWSEEQDVPPPPVYDPMRYPRGPAQGYR